MPPEVAVDDWYVTIVVDLSSSAFQCFGKKLLLKQLQENLTTLLDALKSSRVYVTLVVSLSQVTYASSQTLCQCAPLITENDKNDILDKVKTFTACLEFHVPSEYFGVCDSEVSSSIVLRYGVLSSLLAPQNCNWKSVIVLSDLTGILPLKLYDEFLKLFNLHQVSCSFVFPKNLTDDDDTLLNYGFIHDTSMYECIAFNTGGAVFSSKDMEFIQLREVLASVDSKQRLSQLQSSNGLKRIDGTVNQKFTSIAFEDTSLDQYLASKLREGFRFDGSCPIQTPQNSFCLKLAVRGDCLIKLEVNFEEHIKVCEKFSVTVYIEGPYTYLHDLFYFDTKCNHPSCSIGNYGVGCENRIKGVERTMKILHSVINKAGNKKLKSDIRRFVKYMSSDDLPESVAGGMQFFKLQYHSSGDKISIPNFDEDIDICEHMNFWSFVYSLDLNTWQKFFYVHKLVYTMQPDPSKENLFSMLGNTGSTRSRIALKNIHDCLQSFTKVVIQEHFLYAGYLEATKDEKKHLVLIRVNPDLQDVFSHCYVLYVAFPLDVDTEDQELIVNDLKTQLANLEMTVDGRNVPVVTQFTKCMEKLVMRYDACPDKFELVLPSGLEFPVDEASTSDQYQSRVSLNVYSTLSRFLQHRRWIRRVPNLTAIRSSLRHNESSASLSNSALGNCYEKVMKRIVKLRLDEGFQIVYGTQGVVLLVKELPVVVSETMSSTVIIQYVCFKPRVSRDSSNVFLVTESWIEPHHGLVDASFLEAGCLCSYQQLVNKLEGKDQHVLTNLLNFLNCREMTVNDYVDIQNLQLSPPKNQNSEPEREYPFSTVFKADFCFDALELCRHSKLFTMIFRSFSRTADGYFDKRNELLLRTFHDFLEKSTQISFHLSHLGSCMLASILSKRSPTLKQLEISVAEPTELLNERRNSQTSTLVSELSDAEYNLNIDKRTFNWVIYIASLSDERLFYVLVPYKLSDLSGMSDVGMDGCYGMPVFLFDSDYNELCLDAVRKEIFVPHTLSESSSAPIDPQLLSDVAANWGVLDMIQNVFNQSYARVLYYLMVQHANESETQDRLANHYSWTEEVRMLAKILDRMNDSAEPENFCNLTPLLSLNCKHLDSVEKNEEDKSSLQRCFNGNVDCSYPDSLDFEQVLDISESFADKSKDCMNDIRANIQTKFGDLLKQYYYPVDSLLKCSDKSQTGEFSNILLWKDLEKRSDDDSVAFRDPGDLDEYPSQSSHPWDEVLSDTLPEPLFVRLECTAEINGELFCVVSLGTSIPTCLEELFLNVYKQVEGSDNCVDNLNYLSKIEVPTKIHKLRVCVRFRFLHLTPLDSCFNKLEDLTGGRVRASSSMFEPSNFRAPVVESEEVESNFDANSNIPDQKEFLDTMNWFISDVVASALHDVSLPRPLDEELQEKVKAHVFKYESQHENSLFRDMTLSFVQKDDASFALLESELTSYAFKNIQVRRAGPKMYALYVDPNSEVEPKLPPDLKCKRCRRSKLESVISSTASDTGSDCGGCSRNESNIFIRKRAKTFVEGTFMGRQTSEFNDNQREASLIDEFVECVEKDNFEPLDSSSLIDSKYEGALEKSEALSGNGSQCNVSDTLQGGVFDDYDADMSEMDNGGLERDARKPDSFWMIFELIATVDDYKCCVYFHKPFYTEDEVYPCDSEEAYHAFEKHVHNSVHKVNQIKLLDNFYTTENCLPILLNDEKSGHHESMLDWRELAGTSHFSRWNADEFKCDRLKKIVMPIHVRIQPSNPRMGSEYVSDAVGHVFQKNRIKDAKHPPTISLYRSEEGHVFYFKCSIEDVKAEKKQLSDGSSYNADGNPATSLSYSTPRLEYSLVVNIYGVDEQLMDKFLQEDLKAQLDASLREKTLSQLWSALIAGQCKLYNADVRLLQPRNTQPDVYMFEVPSQFSNYMYSVVWHLKTNLDLYTVEPKYWNLEDHDEHFRGPSGEACQSVNCRLYVEDTEKRRLRNSAIGPKSFRTKSIPGISLIEFSLILPEGFGFSSRDVSSSILSTFDKDNLPKCRLVDKHELDPNSCHIQFCVWETGKVDSEKLLDGVLRSCATQSLCDVYIEHMLLRNAPITVESQPSFEAINSDLFSLPVESKLSQYVGNADHTAFYFHTAYPWLVNCYQHSKCLSVNAHECVINFRQRLSEFFFSVQLSIKQDKSNEFHWLLYRSINGHLHKIRDQSLTKPLNSSEMGLDFPEAILPPQTDQPEYYFVAYNPNDWTTAARSRHASGNSESKLFFARHHQAVNVPKCLFVDTVNRRSVIIGKLQNRILTSVAYSIPAFSNFLDQFDIKAQSMNVDSRVLNCIVRQKMGLYNHRCFNDKYKKHQSLKMSQFYEKFKEHRVPTRMETGKFQIDEMMKVQPDFYAKIKTATVLDKSVSNSKVGQFLSPKVKHLFVESLRQFAQCFEHRRSKESTRMYLKKFEDSVTEQKSDVFSISRDELELILSRSRLYHYVTTPMFFATSWHRISSPNMDRSDDRELHDWYDKRKENIMDAFAAKFDRWVKLEIQRTNVTHGRSKHHSGNQLQSSNQSGYFANSAYNQARLELEKTSKFTRFMVRSVNYGGVAILKFGFYINDYDCFFCVQLNTFLFRKTRAANSFELFDDYYQKLDYLLQNMHVHSFAYDYQLDLVWNYILGKHGSDGSLNTCPELESSQRNVLSFLNDFIKFHHGKAPSSSIKRLLCKELRVSLGVGEDIDPKQFYEYLVERKNTYGIVCITVPGMKGRTELENTTLVTRSYDLAASPSLRSFLIEQLQVVLLFAHESFLKTQHRHGHHATHAGNYGHKFCCQYDLNKIGNEKVLLIRYFLIVKSEVSQTLAAAATFERNKPNLRAEDRRKVLMDEQERSKSLNEVLVDQDRACSNQIVKVIERVQKDFHRDLLLNKIVDYCCSDRMENSGLSFPSGGDQPSSRGQTFLVFNSAADSKLKKTSTSSSVSSPIFQSCLSDKESLMLLDFFFPVSLVLYLAQSHFCNVDSEPRAVESFDLKLSQMLEVIMPKIDHFLVALSKIAAVHVLNFAPASPDSDDDSSPEYASGKRDAKKGNQSKVSEGQCAVLFRKGAENTQYATLAAVPDFIILMSRGGKLPDAVLRKLRHSSKATGCDPMGACCVSSSTSLSVNKLTDLQLIVVSTFQPSDKRRNKLYSPENIAFVQSLYKFMIYFSYLN